MFFRVLSLKNGVDAWTLDSEGIWGFMLESACTSLPNNQVLHSVIITAAV